MTFSQAGLPVCVILAALALWYGTRRKVNRRRRGVLGEPSPACRRNGPEACP